MTSPADPAALPGRSGAARADRATAGRRRGAGKRFLVVGDVLDGVLVQTSVGEVGRHDPDAVIRHRPLGAGGNTATWLGWLGAEVDLVARAGVDDVHRYERAFADAGVRAHVGYDARASTGAVVSVRNHRGRSGMTDPGAAGALTASDVSADLVRRAHIVHLTGAAMLGGGSRSSGSSGSSGPGRPGADPAAGAHGSGAAAGGAASGGAACGRAGTGGAGSSGPASGAAGADTHDPGAGAARIADLVALARSAGARVALDPSSDAVVHAVGATAFLDALEGVDVVLPNAREALALTGATSVEDAVQALVRRVPLVVVTLGPEGVLLGRPGRSPQHVAATPATVVDTLGAGDAFAAGFLRAWATDPVRIGAAAREGTRVAARALGFVGGRPPV